ncbi:MAG: cupin domain-containing protein [Desulfobulbaceae bacterium]|nr:cupin domain-containing protein [Desulfobulbaceae bacterium]
MKKIILTALLLICSAATAYSTPQENPLARENVANLSQTIQYSDQGFAKKPVFKGATYDILLFAFQKGQQLPAHTISLDAFILVLEGNATVIIDGKEYEVAAGEKISLPKNLSHALTAKENFKMLLVK